MYNFLTPIDPGARATHRRAYREYLIERDGDCDSIARTLSRREAQMHRFENIEPKHSLDRAEFERLYRQFDSGAKPDMEMVLLLALCKLNAAEAFGVEKTMSVAEDLVRQNADNDIEMRVLIEEHYHTRILQSTAREYGLTVANTFQPPLSLRGLIGVISSLPVPMIRPLVMGSELVGTIMFAQMFCRARDVLAHKPELRDRILERIVEILIDEIGHVSLNQLELSAWGMYQTRRLFSLVALGMRDSIPEWRVLGVNSSTDLSWLKRVPAEVFDRAFVLHESQLHRGVLHTAAV